MNSLLSRRSVLAIAAVVDISLHSRSAPVAAKMLAARHNVQPPSPRGLCSGGWFCANILKGVRGPRRRFMWRASAGASLWARSCAPRCR